MLKSRRKLPKINTTTAALQFFAGSLSYLYIVESALDEFPTIKLGMRAISSVLALRGASQLLEASMVKYSQGSVDRKIRRKRQREDAVQTYRQLDRARRIFYRSLTTLSSMVLSYRYWTTAQTLIEQGESLFSLYFKSADTDRTMVFSVLHGPFIIPVMLGIGLVGLVYNARELKYAIESDQPRQNDSALLEFINSLALLSTSAKMGHYLQSQQSVETLRFEPGTSIDHIMQQVELAQQRVASKYSYFTPLLLSAVNSSAAFRVYHGFLQVINQARIEFMSRYEIEVEEIQQPEPTIKPRQPKRRPQPKNESTEHVPYHDYVSTEDTYQPPVLKEKVKTRGQTNIQPESISTKKVSLFKDIVHKRHDPMRLEKLSLIANYRRLSEIKVSTINQELAHVTRFLPDGAQIIPLGGSMFQLNWSHQDKTYKLKFEKPHGNKHDYQGFRLKKVLNVIETAYLWGWEPKAIEQHIKSQSSNYLGRLVNIFLTRPEPTSSQMRLTT